MATTLQFVHRLRVLNIRRETHIHGRRYTSILESLLTKIIKKEIYTSIWMICSLENNNRVCVILGWNVHMYPFLQVKLK